MKSRLASLPLALAAACVSASPAAAQTLTIAQARTLPVQELARRFLGASGALYREIERPGRNAGISLPGAPPLGLTSLAFAASPRSAGFAGLCAADVAFVSFRAIRTPTQTDADPPARVSGLSTARLYRIVGDPESRTGEDWTSRREERLERSCNSSGPAFAAGASRRFFSGTAFGVPELRPAHAWFAARALHQAISLAAAGAIQPACTPNPSFSVDELCGDPARRVAQLRPEEVAWVVLDRCSAASADLCVTVSFVVPDSTPWSARIVDVVIATDSPRVDPPLPRVNVRRVLLRGTHRAV